MFINFQIQISYPATLKVEYLNYAKSGELIFRWFWLMIKVYHKEIKRYDQILCMYFLKWLY